MHFYYEMDEDQSHFEADNLTGYLSLRHEEGVIEEHDIFLDSWLAALVEGLSAVKAGETESVIIEEEDHPLVFEPEARGFRVSYGEDSVTVPDAQEFREVLTSACRVFLFEAQSRIGMTLNAPLNRIRVFVERGR